jgi:hypothetical protein
MNQFHGMFKDNFDEYIRIILRTRNSYKSMEETIDKIENIEQRKKLISHLELCKKDINTLADELKRHGHLN